MILDYKIQGFEQGKPLLLIHGLFGTKSNLGSCARNLIDTHKVISVDARNHGDSFHADSMNYQEMASDIVALLKHLSIEQCTVLGHSMGGKIAMQLALSHAEFVEKLIVVDIAPVTYPPGHTAILDGLKRLNETEIKSRQQANDILLPFVETDSIRSFLLKNLVRKDDSNYELKLNFDVIYNNYEQLLSDVTGEPFQGECLFVKGGESNYLQTKHRETILKLFPKAQLKEIANTGHWPHSENPQLFNSIIERFLTTP